jgi:hypothetical protein
MRKKLDNLTVMMATVTTNDPGYPPRYMMLRLADDTSGQVIAEIEIMPDELINFYGSGQAKAAGWLNDQVHRLGRLHRWYTYKITGIEGYGAQPEHHRVLAAIAQARDDGWETWDYRFSHGKHELVVRKWIDPEDAEATSEG